MRLPSGDHRGRPVELWSGPPVHPPAVGVVETKATRTPGEQPAAIMAPSGDQTGAPPPPRSRTRPPLAETTPTSRPPRLTAIRSPSGDQAGHATEGKPIEVSSRS